ncbi:MAG: protein kinase [Elusimicrobia bacterium]|nr:protein kinase [Elusimicrobiota bacterium]
MKNFLDIEIDLSRDRWLLPKDLLVTPIERFGDKFVRKALGRPLRRGEGAFVASRALTRSDPKLLGIEARALLERFRTPRTLLQAVLDLAAERGASPQEVLKDIAEPVRRFIGDGFLIKSGPQNSLTGGVIVQTLRVGQLVRGRRVMRCVRPMIDVELYLIEGSGNRRCALKLLRPQFHSPKAGMFANEQLRRERAALEQLAGTAAVRLVDAGDWKRRPFVAVEWIDGPSVELSARRIRTSGASPVSRQSQLLRLADDALAALESIHARGYLHGDIHPQNLILQGDRVRVIDFGLARRIDDLSRPPVVGMAGVLEFMPPEAARAMLDGKDYYRRTIRSEVYSAGVLTFFILTGKLPHKLTVHRRKAIIDLASFLPLAFHRPFIPKAIEQVLRRALDKTPRRRFPSLRSFRQALEQATAPQTSAPAIKTGSFAHTRRDLDIIRRKVGLFLEGVRKSDHRSLSQSLRPPRASVGFGGGGVAYALLRGSEVFDDPGLLTASMSWIEQCQAGLDLRSGIYSAPAGMTAKTINLGSVLFSRTGLSAVEVLIAEASDMASSREQALMRVSSTIEPALRSSSDLFLGLPGWLAMATILAKRMEDPRALSWAGIAGQTLLDRTRTDGYGDSGLGLAHGRSGVLFSLIQWARTAGVELPPSVKNETLRIAEPVLSGAAHPREAGPWFRAELRGTLCNGLPGLALFLSRAYEHYGDETLLAAARAAITASGPHSDHTNVCCGIAGRAYALLSVARVDPSGPWRDLALKLCLRALENPYSRPWPYGLLKGAPGIVCLALDMLDTDTTPACPFLET